MYLRGLGVYLPRGRIHSREIAERSGLPEWVVREKLGILEKPVPGPEDHPAQMALWAAEKALEEARVPRDRVGAVLSIVEEHKDYPVWATAPYLAHRLGLPGGLGMDLNQKCASFMGALEVARGLFATRKDLEHLLIAGGYRNGDLVDYRDEAVRFMYDLAPGGAAALVSREGPGLRVLGLAHRMDPSLALMVKVPVGGTRAPLRPETLGEYRLRVEDPAYMKARLDATSLPTFKAVVEEALAEAGYTLRDLDFLGVLHMKPSAHRGLLEALGLSEAQSLYLDRYGHLGQLDPILILDLARKEGRVRPGSLIGLVAAGVGYFYGAAVLRWEEG
jgi:3-oxoacyl-[acyl-carrier-protein] synthase-3